MSAECKDLLTRLLVADSEQRLSMEEIKAHPWFTHALPSGAVQMNDWYMREANGIDEVCFVALKPEMPALWLVPYRRAAGFVQESSGLTCLCIFSVPSCEIENPI